MGLQKREGLNQEIIIIILAIALHYILEERSGPCPTYCEVEHKHNIKIEELINEQEDR